MSDAFNFDGLRKVAPKYLGMDSLKEALPSDAAHDEIDHNPVDDHMVYEDDNQPMYDVSMTDQELIDEPKPEKHLIVSEGDNNAESIISKEREFETNDFSKNEIPKETVSTDTTPIWRNPERQSNPLHTVIAPTQAGAHQALGPYAHHYIHYPPQDPRSHWAPYDDDLKMPIPPPWHKNIQYTFSTYLQLGFNIAIISFIGWSMLIIKDDVAKKISERRSILIRDAHWCQEQFIMNHCRSGRAAPHLIENKKCLELEHCMDQDPENIRWLSMYASSLAEIMNELISPLQMRTIVCLLSGFSIIVLVVGANYWFGFWRAKSYFYRNSKKHETPRNSQKEAHLGSEYH